MKNKDADQLCSYCTADLHLCFCLCMLLAFLCDGSYVILVSKPGSCPSIFLDYNRDNAYSDWCWYDRGCSFDHKCCRNRRGVRVCAAPAPGKYCVFSRKCLINTVENLMKIHLNRFIACFVTQVRILNIITRP